MSNRYFIQTFGCQMNVADSEDMTARLKLRGFLPTENRDEADIVLINTCTIRAMADHKAFSFIGKLKPWKEASPGRILIVTGCGVERDRAKFQKRFPYVDLLLGAKLVGEYDSRIEALLKNRYRDFDEVHPLTDGGQASDLSQMVTIMRGCNYNCTYCIVPAVRGREVYESRTRILDDVSARVAGGAKEIWLLGQTVNSYKPPDPPFPGYGFSDLLKDINAIDGLRRIRFASPHPFYVDETFAKTMASCEKVCEHIHLPVQSGSDRILGAMKRNYTRDTFMKAVGLLRMWVPGISITTDFIVGFPGETDDDFQMTMDLARAAEMDSAYCFKYSPRPGTSAFGLKDDVPASVKEARVNALLALTETQGIAKAKALVGSRQEVLMTEQKGTDVFRGRARSSWRVRVKDARVQLGGVYPVQITAHHSRELHGELV